MTENMRIWDAVSKTNPANTKKVTQRGSFTSICAQSQIMEATRQFGPIGIGWGYTAAEPVFHDNLVFVRVMLWHGNRANEFGPVTGGAEWKSDKGRLDSDAAKKATTDGLTKLLSQLGFNADVFLGLYDDSKYVAAVAREFAGQDNATPALITDDQRDIIQGLADASGTTLQTICDGYQITNLKQLPASKYGKLVERLKGLIPTAEKPAEKAAA